MSEWWAAAAERAPRGWGVARAGHFFVPSLSYLQRANEGRRRARAQGQNGRGRQVTCVESVWVEEVSVRGPALVLSRRRAAAAAGPRRPTVSLLAGPVSLSLSLCPAAARTPPSLHSKRTQRLVQLGVGGGGKCQSGGGDEALEGRHLGKRKDKEEGENSSVKRGAIFPLLSLFSLFCLGARPAHAQTTTSHKAPPGPAVCTLTV